MASRPDFGWRPGFAQLGSYRASGGLAFIYVGLGDPLNPASGTLNAWIASFGPFTDVVMVQPYEPAAVGRYPVRAAVGGGVACQFPSVEADALVAAGIATYA